MVQNDDTTIWDSDAYRCEGCDGSGCDICGDICGVSCEGVAEVCPECDGSGTIRDGLFEGCEAFPGAYQDIKCEACNGTGQVEVS